MNRGEDRQKTGLQPLLQEARSFWSIVHEPRPLRFAKEVLASYTLVHDRAMMPGFAAFVQWRFVRR
jgi:hypothetical protein